MMQRAPRGLTFSAVAGVAVIIVLLAGCLANERGPDSPKLGKVISDVTLTLSVRDASGAEEFYAVKRDGEFGFGGGMDARFERITWTTQLTPAVMQTLRDLMVSNGWFNKDLHSTKQPKEARFEVEAKCEEGTLHKRIEGENDRIDPVRVWLRDIANRRLEVDLERQPKARIQQRPATQPAATQP